MTDFFRARAHTHTHIHRLGGAVVWGDSLTPVPFGGLHGNSIEFGSIFPPVTHFPDIGLGSLDGGVDLQPGPRISPLSAAASVAQPGPGLFSDPFSAAASVTWPGSGFSSPLMSPTMLSPRDDHSSVMSPNLLSPMGDHEFSTSSGWNTPFMSPTILPQIHSPRPFESFEGTSPPPGIISGPTGTGDSIYNGVAPFFMPY